LGVGESYERVLIGLIESLKAERVAEIGVYKSHLAKAVLRSPGASTIREYWAVDRWVAGTPAKQAKSDGLFEYATKLMGWFPALRVMRSDSVKAAEDFVQGYFDIVFIDADHSYVAVNSDINAWMPKVRSGGFLCGHDFFEGMDASHPGVARAVREWFGDAVLTHASTVWVRGIP